MQTNGRHQGVVDLNAHRRRQQRQNQQRAMEKPDNKIVIREFDHIILVCTFLLVGFGLVMVFSASSYAAMHNSDPNITMYSLFIQQATAAAFGLFVMVLAATFSYDFVARFTVLLYPLSIALLLAVLVTPWGVEHNGALRWLSIGGFNLQPSELAKVSVTLALATYISKDPNRANSLKGLLICAIIVALPVILVALGRNLSTVIILCAMAFIIIFLASPHFWRFVAIAVAGAGGIVAFLILGEGFRQARISAWLDPFAYPLGVGFQTIQSLYAVASGGLFGLGLGNSNQKLYYMSEAQNDFIFAIIVEELGLFGGGIVLLLFGILIWRGVMAAINCKTLLGSLIATGFLTMVAVQVIINVGVVTNTIPNTGIPLPFISFGGTSLVVMMGAMGMLMSVSRHKNKS